MVYEQLFEMIKDPKNKVFKTVISIKAGLENVKYSLRSEKGKMLLYVLGCSMTPHAPDWVVNVVFVDGQKQSFSLEQIAAVFSALASRHIEEEKLQNALLQKKMRTK